MPEFFLLKKRLFSSAFCEMFKNTFFYRTPAVAASALTFKVLMSPKNIIIKDKYFGKNHRKVSDQKQSPRGVL